MKHKKTNKKDVIRAIALTLAMLLVAGMCVLLGGCGNKRVFDTTWTFEKAIIFLPDGEKVEGKISTWDDYDGSDMIQVTVEGKTYLTHSSNVVMISE